MQQQHRIWNLRTSGLDVLGAVISSDKRLKINNRPLGHALDVIKRLETVDYDQTHNLLDLNTPDTPQAHQYGLKGQCVQEIEELYVSVIGGEVGDDGLDTSWCFKL